MQLRHFVWLSMPMHVGLVNFWVCQRCSFGLSLPTLFVRLRFATAVRSASVSFSRSRFRVLAHCFFALAFEFSQPTLPPAAVFLAVLSDLPLAVASTPPSRRRLHEGHLGSHCNNEGTHVPGGDNDDNATKNIAVMPKNTLNLRK